MVNIIIGFGAAAIVIIAVLRGIVHLKYDGGAKGCCCGCDKCNHNCSHNLIEAPPVDHKSN